MLTKTKIKLHKRDAHWKEDLQKAYEAGKRMVE